ncbi:MAG TPA: DUF1697 domain-containing protein [Gaiellaceae bacterium]|nr:DUF1697 domain-containing protein [Gaiellaceae bacterium]
MTAYVALLRGVNVGSHGRIDMATLKRTFEQLGCEDVRTYINSGNVLFHDRRKPATLTRLAEKELGTRVAIRTLAQLDELCASIPEHYADDREQKTDVAFLLDEPGERVFNARRADLERGQGIVEVDGPVTVRNVNTVRKLRALLAALERN